jgi:hypothetical protein
MLVRSLFLFLIVVGYADYGFGEIEHRGFVGGPFHGVVQIQVKEISVQLGPTADLTAPESLVAHAEQSQVSSGGESRLRASLRLDDGTHTVLDPSIVEWAFSTPNLRVKNGSLIADVLKERTMVRVQATAEGFSTSFNIFVLADDRETEKEVEESLPQVLRTAIELEAAGWKESEWFGVFYDAENGWLYHTDHGWIHVAEGGQDAAWFWSDTNQWVWTGKNVYPHLYRNRDAAWLYFFKQALPVKLFYNQKTQEFERLAGN